MCSCCLFLKPVGSTSRMMTIFLILMAACNREPTCKDLEPRLLYSESSVILGNPRYQQCLRELALNRTDANPEHYASAYIRAPSLMDDDLADRFSRDVVSYFRKVEFTPADNYEEEVIGEHDELSFLHAIYKYKPEAVVDIYHQVGLHPNRSTIGEMREYCHSRSIRWDRNIDCFLFRYERELYREVGDVPELPFVAAPERIPEGTPY